MVVLKRLVPAAALICALSACSESLGPDSVNPTDMSASVATLRSTFDHVSFQSMAELAFLFPVYPAVAALRASLPEAPGRRPAAPLAGARRRSDAARLLAELRANPTALFPPNVLGKTLEWNPVDEAYEVGTLPGAPATGMRIVIYTVNAVTGEPNVNQQLGFVELTDESTPQADRLGVLLTLGTATVADYLVTGIFGTDLRTIEAQGFIRAATGTGQVDFDFFQAYEPSTGTLTIITDLVGNDGRSIHAGWQANAATASFDVGVSVGRNDLLIQVGLGATNAIAGGVKYNGETVGTVAGIITAPTFTGAGGRTMTAAEIGALDAIFHRALDAAGELSDAVFRPSLVVFTPPGN